jgi:ribosomal protein S18 acetylase RimI-like enzyme
VTALFVDPAHRRQGVGTRLMAAAEQYAAERGAQIRVSVNESSWGARAFFGAINFKRA